MIADCDSTRLLKLSHKTNDMKALETQGHMGLAKILINLRLTVLQRKYFYALLIKLQLLELVQHGPFKAGNRKTK